MKYVHVQSVLPQEDVIALKQKSGESSVKEAISKAVYHYLKCELASKNEKWMNLNLGFFYIAGKKQKKKNNMKCANCGKEIRDGDYIHVSTPNKKDIYLHSIPCEWYEKTDDSAAHWG